MTRFPPAAASRPVRFECSRPSGGDPRVATANVERPLIAALVRQVLPQAVFERHPELARVLHDASVGRHHCFGHFISKAAIRCRNAGCLHTLVGPDAGYLAYVQRLARQIVAQSAGPVWLLHLPEPVAPGEAHCAAIVETPRPRYFTLEHTAPGAPSQVVETRPDGVRYGFGFLSRPDAQQFAARVQGIVG